MARELKVCVERWTGNHGAKHNMVLKAAVVSQWGLSHWSGCLVTERCCVASWETNVEPAQEFMSRNGAKEYSHIALWVALKLLSHSDYDPLMQRHNFSCKVFYKNGYSTHFIFCIVITLSSLFQPAYFSSAGWIFCIINSRHICVNPQMDTWGSRYSPREKISHMRTPKDQTSLWVV